MNALRTIRTFVLFGSVALLALGTIATPAKAGGPCHSNYGCYKSSCYYPPSCNYNYCRTTSCYPTYYSSSYPCVTPICCPVTVYDCFGQPHVVMTTSYSSFVR